MIFDQPVQVIAHRGASGYLPEHTLPAKALAYGMKPHFIEQDVVMTEDGQLVILHDIYLDEVTNVASVFPGRDRADGRFYAIDFTLAEIRTLSVSERFHQDSKQVVYGARFPMWQSQFRVPTLQEEIELIHGLNQSLGHNVGLYVEIKSPQFHLDQGYDISASVLKTLKKYGYQNKSQPIYLQCFDGKELQRIHGSLMPTMAMDLKLVHLFENNWLDTIVDAIPELSTWVDAIGVHSDDLVPTQAPSMNPSITPLAATAHEYNLEIHVYTLRQDQMPTTFQSFEAWIDVLTDSVGVTGIFTDFPDRVVNHLRH